MSRLTTSFPARVIKRYLDAQGPNQATLIAWNALFAFFPMVLITLTLLSLVLHNTDIDNNVKQAVVNAFPSQSAQDAVNGAIEGVKHNSGLFAVIGFLGLMWSGSALFGAIEQALAAMQGFKTRDFFRQKLMAGLMILLFTVLTIPLVLSSALLPALQHLSFVPSLFTSGPAGLLIQVGAGILDGTVIFLAIYFVVPNRRLRLRQVLVGAVVAGVLLEAFTFLFPLYVQIAGGFNTYGATFALFFLLMTFMYFLGQIVVIGAAVIAELAGRHEQQPQTALAIPGKAQRERALQDQAR
jgi:membrane protein